MTNDQITVSRELLRQVLNTISLPQAGVRTQEAVKELRTALEQPAVEPMAWNQVQVCTWIGNQLMTHPSMFERNTVCKFVRSLGRSEKLAKYFPVPTPQAQQPAEVTFLTDKEILEMTDDGVFLGNVKEIAMAVEAVVRKKAGLKLPRREVTPTRWQANLPPTPSTSTPSKRPPSAKPAKC